MKITLGTLKITPETLKITPGTLKITPGTLKITLVILKITPTFLKITETLSQNYKRNNKIVELSSEIPEPLPKNRITNKIKDLTGEQKRYW